jgi:hypothetical protein
MIDPHRKVRGSATVWPAPRGEELSARFSVRVEGESPPVHLLRVAPGDPDLRWKAMDDKAGSARYFEEAGFVTFDMTGTVTVEVDCGVPVRSARLLPSAPRIAARIDGRTVAFELRGPGHVTLEVNDDWVHSLHLFANPPETEPPREGDPDVIFFGPGVHEVGHLAVGSGTTVYVAGGAVVRGVIGQAEPYGISGYSGLKTYAPTFQLEGRGICVRGRGIIDGSRSTTHAKNLLLVKGSDILVEGVVLRDASTWTIPVRESDRVTIRNVKVLGYRANSDGIDICSSRDVTVEDCFLRTLDDLVVVKTDRHAGRAERIVARRCVLWNEVAHALSIGAELREDVADVLFTDCDVIHDKGREWTLRVYHCDSARVSNVRFENLRIEECRRLASLWIDADVWTSDPERGHIDGVVFRCIDARGDCPRIELKGFDDAHAVEEVLFENVTLNGRAVTHADVERNAFVRGVSIVTGAAGRQLEP